MSWWRYPIEGIGKILISGISNIGEIVCILIRTIKCIPYVHKNVGLIVKQMVSIGVSSIPLLFVTSIFTGMVATVQAEFQFRDLVADKFVGTAACKMI